MDTAALAAAFPFASPDLPARCPASPPPPAGVLYGVNTASPGVVLWDRWAQDNHNCVVLARSGAGKSYFVKLDVLRTCTRACRSRSSTPKTNTPASPTRRRHRRAARRPGVRLNPLDLPAGDRARHVADPPRPVPAHPHRGAARRASPPPAERAALDRAIIATYQQAGITADPATWTRPAPLLRDLAATLRRRRRTRPPRSSAARLAPWTTGHFADLFDGPTTTRPDGHLVVWSLRHLPDELRTVGTLLALDSIWRAIDRPAEPSPAAGSGGWSSSTRRGC